MNLDQDERLLLAVKHYLQVRQFSIKISEPLTPEDCAIQSTPDVSPIRWHLAHTTWFFETFLLKTQPSYVVFNEAFETLFNSYYNSVGQPFPRDRRGQISRPGLNEVHQYRQHVDEAMKTCIEQNRFERHEWDVLTLGLQHEQQHQELMLTDIKHGFYSNPLHPAYHDDPKVNILSPLNDDAKSQSSISTCSMRWHCVEEGIVQVGHAGKGGFSFDNETPRHRTYLQQHEISSRCVTNGEFLDFINDKGYTRPDLWLSLGWAHLIQQQWQAPLYWICDGDSWSQFTLSGVLPLNLNEPVCHVSYFEADAFARWAGKRLPTEFEWETSANNAAPCGVFADVLFRNREPIHPQIEAPAEDVGINMFGNVWQWTGSHYSPYPGYRPASGALGEYNGKFMCNQFVLRGGSCATSSDHIRATYRNFFPPETRWQFTSVRLAND